MYLKEGKDKRIENSSVVSLWMEMIDTLDGICILHQNHSISAANVLIRKLIEIDVQLRYILIEDYENKALAYEAYYVSRAAEGEDVKNNIFQQFDRYKLYKKEADKVFSKDDVGNTEGKKRKGDLITGLRYMILWNENVEIQKGLRLIN